MARNTVYLIDQLGHFHLDLHTILIGVDAVGGLNRQLPDPVQNILGFLKVTFSSLDKRHTVLYIPFGLIQPPDLAPHLLGDRQTGSIISRPVYTLPGAEPFNTSRYVGIGNTQGTVGVQGAHVMIYNQIITLLAF
jgi:hypothetical protein